LVIRELLAFGTDYLAKMNSPGTEGIKNFSSDTEEDHGIKGSQRRAFLCRSNPAIWAARLAIPLK
jgi:hypothetical protein